MKDIAVLLGGRFYKSYLKKDNEDTIKQIKEKNCNFNLDLYLHIWKEDIWGNFFNKDFHNKYIKIKQNNIEEIEKIINYYNPKKYIINDVNEINKMKNFTMTYEIIIFNLITLFNIREKDYDIYIFTRPDLMFNQFNLFLDDYLLKENEILCYNGGANVPICDWFFIMDHKTIEKISKVEFNSNKNIPNETNIFLNLVEKGFTFKKIGNIDKNICLKNIKNIE